MTETTVDTIVHRLLRNAAASPERIALRRKRDSGWQTFTWSEYAGLATAAARAFTERGLQPGQPVAILAGNRLEWAIAALGALSAGGVVAGVYPTLTAEQTAYVVGHSGAPIAVVENREQLDKLRAQRAALPVLAHVLILDG
ncbi:MAG: AMP-binding protein, partial [Acidobacteriota bacterium]